MRLSGSMQSTDFGVGGLLDPATGLAFLARNLSDPGDSESDNGLRGQDGAEPPASSASEPARPSRRQSHP